MLTWIKQVRHFIKEKDKPIEGGAHMYLLAIYLILFMLVIFKIATDRERVYVTYDTVDDSIVESLVSACIVNTEEYGRSDQLVIYRTLTPIKVPSIYDQIFGVVGGPAAPPYDPLNDSEIWSPGNDDYLDDSYEKFEKNLKRNLKLDDDMTAVIDGIEGVVTIEEFSIYNVFQDFDDSGNETGRRVVKYTITDSGTWTVYPYGIDENVEVYNSFDKTNTPIEATSVVAKLSFDIRLSDYSSWLMSGKTEADMVKHVTYQRIVDVIEN